MKKKYHPVLYVIGLIVYASYAVYLFFGKDGVVSWAREHGAENIAQSMKATKPWIEVTREFGGLVILIVVLICNMVWLRKVEGFKRLSVEVYQGIKVFTPAFSSLCHAFKPP